MMIAIIAIALVFVYLSLNFAAVLLRNYKAHRFYKTKCPNLPVLPYPSIFSGNMFEVIHPGKNWRIIGEHHEKLGPTYGYYMCEQPWVSTKDIDILKLIEVEQAHRHINRSKFGLPFHEFNTSIFQVDGDDWRRVRRAISPALTNHKVRSDEVSGDIRSILDQLARSLELKMDHAEQTTGKRTIEFNAHDAFQRYALAVVFLITYKKDNIIDFNIKQDEWVALIEESASQITNPIVTLAMMFPFLRPFCSFLVQFHRTGKAKMRIIDYIVRASDINRVAREQHEKLQRKMSELSGAKERPFSELKQHGKFKRRLVDTFIDAFIEKKISYDDFVGSAFFLLLAGFETTADTITCLVWHLAHKQGIQDKLRKTIIEEGIDADYVLWCIMETVRWHPAVPLGTGRILSEDITLNGTFLPKGAFVMPSTYSIHHDPSIWPEPDEFKPERWANSASFHPAAFVGFGLGPRNCVGGKLAIHEIKLVLQQLLPIYRIERCANTPAEYSFSSPGLLFTIPDQPIMVRLVALS